MSSAILGIFVPANLTADEIVCHFPPFSAPSAEPDSSRKYAPDREVDILHVVLDVTPDFKTRTVSGKAIVAFKPLGKALPELKLDGIDLTVLSVSATEKIQGYQTTDKNVIITFENPIPVGKEASVTIEYKAEPTEGLYFRTPEMGYREGETEAWSQGEAEDARRWYPNYDYPNEKFTSELICHVPEGMIGLSNGKLVSEEKDPAGLVAFHWKQEKPHVNYLISLVAGYFKKIEDKYRDIPLAFYTPPSDINEAPNSFRITKDAMEFFEKEIGVPYPWNKYYQAVVLDFVAGGMENTSLTSLTDRTLFTDEFENTRNSEGLVSHELAHQWFGDLVTCKDWGHLWLNEGFATFYALLYDEHKNGRDSMLYGLWQTQKNILAQTNSPRAIVSRLYAGPNEQFGYLAYQKGSWVLNMLRAQLGADLYRQCIKTYLERHGYNTVVTEDLNAVIEELSGRSFDPFFDQWVYHALQPEISAEYSWDEKTRTAKISLKQTQKLSDDVLLFKFPLRIRFHTKAGNIDREAQIKGPEEDFYFVLPETPEFVVLDPELELLAKVNFKISNAMLYAILAQKGEVGGKLFAIDQLAAKKDRESVAKLKDVLNKDAFFGVRIEAAKALQTIHSDESFKALQESQKQSDARVRRQVVASLGAFYEADALKRMRAVIESEKNPDILAQALRSLGVFPTPETRETLLKYLESKSYRNLLADAAISAMRTQDNPAYINQLQTVLKIRESEFTTRGFAAGLDTLAYLASNEEKKDSVREFLLSYVNHRKKGIQLGAIAALGTLEDPQAVAVLETFASTAKETPERAAAEKAIATIRAAKRPTDNLGELRNELLELKKHQREARKEVDALKKRLDETAKKPGRPGRK